MRTTFQLLLAIVFTIGFFQATYFAIAKEIKFGLPIKCELNKDCFIQNLPDVVTDKSALDTFCQGATYDGHKGIDIRILSLKDMERNVPVIASADGIVKAYRDGEVDKIIATPEDKFYSSKTRNAAMVSSFPTKMDTKRKYAISSKTQYP